MMQMLWRKAWWGEGNLWGYFTLTLVREVFTERVMLEQRFDLGKTCWIWKMKMWHKGNRTGKDPEMRVCLGCVQAVRRRSEWYESEWVVVERPSGRVTSKVPFPCDSVASFYNDSWFQLQSSSLSFDLAIPGIFSKEAGEAGWNIKGTHVGWWLH